MSGLYRNIRTDHSGATQNPGNRFSGGGYHSKSGRTCPTLQDIDPDLIPRLIVEFVTRVEQPWLMPGLDELLRHSNDTDIALGIISNSQFYTPLTLELCRVNRCRKWGLIPTFASTPLHECKAAKPSHYLYTMAAEGFFLWPNGGIAPSQVLYIGNDLLKGVHAADAPPGPVLMPHFFAGDQQSLRLHEEQCCYP